MEMPSVLTSLIGLDPFLVRKSKLTLQKWIYMIHHWSIGTPVTIACTEAVVAIKTAINLFRWVREVCFTKLKAVLTWWSLYSGGSR